MMTTHELTDPAAIAANQRGELTDTQRERAHRAARGRRGCLTALSQRAGIPLIGIALIAFLAAVQAPHLILWIVILITLIISTELVLLTVPPFIQYQQLLRRDLAEERLATAEGRLVYKHYGYEAMTSDQTLLLPAAFQTELRPDILYRFYFLPRSGYVLSAQALSASPAGEIRAALNAAFAAAFNLNQNVLWANRNGQLTAGQTLRLLPKLLQFTGEFGPGDVLVDLVQGRVEAVEGIGRKIMLPRPYQAHAYQIGEHRFQVSARAFDALIDDLPYRVYHTPRSGLLVSIEPLALQRSLIGSAAQHKGGV